MGFFSWLSGKSKSKETSQTEREASKAEPPPKEPSKERDSEPIDIELPEPVVVFNEPIPEPDDGQRETDPQVVARQVLEHFSRKPPGDYEDLLFLEALWVAVEGDQMLPEFRNQSRHSMAQMVRFAVQGDFERAFEEVRSQTSEVKKGRLLRNIEPLFVSNHPQAVAGFLLEKNYPANYPLVQALARIGATDLLSALLEKEPQEAGKADMLGFAVLKAMDAGQEVKELTYAWEKLGSELQEGPSSENWQRIELCRLARVDIQQAQALHDTLRVEIELFDYIQRDYFLQLGKADPEQALASFSADSEVFDVLPGLIGCHQAGLDIGPLLGDLFLNFSGLSYRPHAAMGWLLKAGILRNDAAFIDKVLEQGGPHGWQTAYYAAYALGMLAGKDPAAATTLLETLMKPRVAGFVAGRDTSTSLVVGTAMVLPPHLDLKQPKPIETLALYAYLGGRGPQWYTEL
ncbi:MAG: hypothetical protein AAFQ98_04005 [Bacteroidota bacterium]